MKDLFPVIHKQNPRKERCQDQTGCLLATHDQLLLRESLLFSFVLQE
jgi:hypothetical protein